MLITVLICLFFCFTKNKEREKNESIGDIDAFLNINSIQNGRFIYRSHIFYIFSHSFLYFTCRVFWS